MVERAITPRTKMIILNSPNNPSGSVMKPEDMISVMRLAHDRGIYVISDECYVYLNYTGHLFSAGEVHEVKERLLILGSLSKTYAMTGWRLGYVLGPAPVVSCDEQAAEPEHVESDVDRAEGGGRGAERLAGLRGGNARRATFACATRWWPGCARFRD